MANVDQPSLGEVWRKLLSMESMLEKFLLRETHEAEQTAVLDRLRVVENNQIEDRRLQRTVLLTVAGQLILTLGAVVWWQITHP